MKMISKALILTTCLLLFMTVNGFAFAVIGNATTATITSSPNRPGGFVGGEFTLTTDLGDQYAAFCVEWEEHISLGTTYSIDSVADYANQGGGINNGASYVGNQLRDYLSTETKWLMNAYVNGGLADKYASYSSAFFGGAMQVAIWGLEEEYYYGSYDAVYGSLAQLLMQEAQVNALGLDPSIFGNVQVVNLANAQSQIIAAPVPEPATMLLLGTGLIGLAGLGRKKFLK